MVLNSSANPGSDFGDSESCAYYYEAMLYYSPNSSLKLLPPPVRDDSYRFFKFNADLNRFTKAETWTSPYGWVSFVPLSPIFDGPFESLSDIEPVAIYEENTFKGYGLGSDQLTAWKRLEEEIYQFIFVLFQEYERQLRPSLLPTPIASLRPEKVHPSTAVAGHHLRRCRDWFCMWIGLMSFRVACVEDSNISGRPWYIALPARGMCPIFVSAVRKSIVCDFKHRRVGTFLQPVTADLGLAGWLQRYNIPIWYPWTEQEVYAVEKSPALKKWRPPTVIVENATTLTRETIPAEVSITKDDIIANAPWKAHFALHDIIHKEKEAIETPSEREERLIRASQPMICMGEKFIWRWNHAVPPTLRRFRLTVEAAHQEIDRPYDELRYDPWCNQWDICSYWGVAHTKGHGNRPEHSANLESSISNWGTCHDTMASENIHSLCGEQSDNEHYILAHSNGPGPIERAGVYIPHARHLELLSLDTCLRLHLGYIIPLPSASWTFPTEYEWMEAMKPIGRTSATSMDRVTEGTQTSVVAFVTSLVQGQEPLATLFDLNTSNANINSVSKRRFHAYFFQCGTRFILRSSVFNDLHACGWNIAVSSVTDALFIYRFLGLKRQPLRWELMETLIFEGIPFNTLVPLHRGRIFSLENVKTPVPIRLSDHVFTVVDYSNYVALRHELLLGPRGRAALLYGGIVTRLALEVLDWEDAVSGPSDAAVDHGLGQTVSGGGYEYGDDALTPDELNIICGLYHVYTGQGEQQSMLSWWPLPHTWNNHRANGYNAGYWTQKNEEWYLTRMGYIDQQDTKNGIPMNPTEWRSYLKGTKASRAVRGTLENMSIGFIS